MRRVLGVRIASSNLEAKDFLILKPVVRTTFIGKCFVDMEKQGRIRVVKRCLKMAFSEKGKLPDEIPRKLTIYRRKVSLQKLRAQQARYFWGKIFSANFQAKQSIGHNLSCAQPFGHEASLIPKVRISEL